MTRNQFWQPAATMGSYESTPQKTCQLLRHIGSGSGQACLRTGVSAGNNSSTSAAISSNCRHGMPPRANFCRRFRRPTHEALKALLHPPMERELSRAVTREIFVFGESKDNSLLWQQTISRGDLTGPVTIVQMTPDGKYVVACVLKDTIIVCDSSTGTELRRWQGLDRLHALVVDDNRVICGDSLGVMSELRIQGDESQWRPVHQWPGHNSKLASLALIAQDPENPDSGEIFSVDRSAKVMTWFTVQRFRQRGLHPWPEFRGFMAIRSAGKMQQRSFEATQTESKVSVLEAANQKKSFKPHEHHFRSLLICVRSSCRC